MNEQILFLRSINHLQVNSLDLILLYTLNPIVCTMRFQLKCPRYD